MIELLGNVRCGVRRGQFTNPSNDQRISTAYVSHGLRPSNSQCRERFRLPADTHLNHLLPFAQGPIRDRDSAAIVCAPPGWL